MRENYWNPVDGSDDKEFDKSEFIQMMKNADVDEDIAAEVIDHIDSVARDAEDSNIIFVFTDDNRYVVTGIHVPAESLDGKPGPVLMRGRSDKSVIAAFSREFISDCLDKIELLESTTGLPADSDESWIAELEKLAQMVRVELATNPPQSWDEMLGGEGDR